MPARSVVIEKLSKFTGEHHEFLTPGEYTQLTGRAGPARHRRASATRSCCWSPFVPFDQVAALASRRTYALTSSFRPTYNMAANLVQRYTTDEAHHLLNLSFAQFHADRDVVALERQLDRTEQQVGRRARAHRTRRRRRRGVPRAGHRAGDAAPHGASGGRRITEALEALRPGDVVMVRRRGGRGRGAEAGAPAGRRAAAWSPSPRVARRAPGPAGLRRAAPARVATIDLPTPFAPRSPAFQPPAADALRRVKLARRRRTPAPTTERRSGRARGRARRAPAARRDPATRAELRAAAAPSASSATSQRLERRVRGRSESLARQFDRVLRVLEAWGYVDGWALTDAGRAARPPQHRERPAARRGAARRPPRRPRPPRARRGRVVLHLPAPRARRAATRCRRARWPHQDGGQAGPRRRAALARPARQRGRRRLPETRRPDPGFTPLRPRLGGGRRPRRRARRRRDDRRRLRPQREAVHRPAAPGRRGRPRPRDRGAGPRGRRRVPPGRRRGVERRPRR